MNQTHNLEFRKNSFHPYKEPRQLVSLDTKIDVLRRYELGERAVDIARALNLKATTVRTIRDRADRIIVSAQLTDPKTAPILTKSRSVIMENMEKHLNDWIERKNQENTSLTRKAIQMKAKSIFNAIKSPGSKETFTASRGWFGRFRQRSNLFSVCVDKNAAHLYRSFGSNYKNEATEFSQNGLEDSFNDNCNDSRYLEVNNEPIEYIPEIQAVQETEEDQNDYGFPPDELSKAFNYLNKAMILFSNHDPCLDRSMAVNRAILDSVSSYKELYEQMIFENSTTETEQNDGAARIGTDENCGNETLARSLSPGAILISDDDEKYDEADT